MNKLKEWRNHTYNDRMWWKHQEKSFLCAPLNSAKTKIWVKKGPSSKLQEWDPSSSIYSLSPLFDSPKCASKVCLWKMKNKTLGISSSSFGHERVKRGESFDFVISHFLIPKMLIKLVYTFQESQHSLFPPKSH